MSNVIHAHTSTIRPSSVLAALGNLASLVIQRHKDRRDMNYLLSLPDYQLKDIGLQRGDVQREALKPLWRL